MGAAESKLAFKNKVFKLAGNDSEPPIPSQDPYWQMFWNEPEVAEDIFNLLTFSDIKTIRDTNKTNFLNLIRIITIKLIEISTSKDFPNPKNHSVKQLLNCIRTLTRLIPFLYEKQDLQQEVNNIFWNLGYNNIDFKDPFNSAISPNATIGSYTTDTNSSSFSNSSTKVNINQPINNSPGSTEVNVGGPNKSVKPLGEQLIHTLVDLLFMRNFTLEKSDLKGVDFHIWEVGIGSNGKYSNPNPELDSNRLEVLRLIITLISQGLYSFPKQIVPTGSRFLTVLVSTIGRLKFLTFICSMLNLVCRSCKSDSENNGLIYAESQYSGNKYVALRRNLVTFSLQLLSTMIVYPLPTSDVKFLSTLNMLNSNEKPHNLVRSYFGRLHKENELNFIFVSLFNFLNKPMEQAIENELNPFNMLKSNFTPGSPTSLNSSSSSSASSSFPVLSSWTPEIIILLWELIQCNKNFKNFVYSKKIPDLLVTLLYYIKYYKGYELWKSSLVRIACYFFLYLTADELVVAKLLTPINQNYYHNHLPNFYKINTSSQPNNLTYRDFLIIQICNTLINDEFDSIITSNFFELLYNLIPIKHQETTVHYKTKSILSYHSSLSIVNVVAKYGTSSVLSNNLMLDLLALVVRAITHSCCRYHRESRTLLYVLTKHEQVFQNLLLVIESLKIESELDDIQEDENEEIEEEDNAKAESPDVDDDKSQTTVQDNEDEFDNSYKSNNASKDEFEESLRPKPPTGMSSKAKSKLPIDAPLTKTWAGYKSLIVILKLIEFVKVEVPNIQDSTKSEIVESLIKIESIKDYQTKISRFVSSEFLPKTKLETLKFTWSTMSLAWYESILWGDIFYQNTTKDTTPNLWFNKRNSGISNIKEVASSWGFNWKSNTTQNTYQFDNSILQLSIWNGTFIRLFKIKKPVMERPLVDVNNLMKRFRLNSASSVTTLNTLDSRNSGLNSPRHDSISAYNSPNQLTPINSRQSFNNTTPRNSIHINSRQNSVTNIPMDSFVMK